MFKGQNGRTVSLFLVINYSALLLTKNSGKGNTSVNVAFWALSDYSFCMFVL